MRLIQISHFNSTFSNINETSTSLLSSQFDEDFQMPEAWPEATTSSNCDDIVEQQDNASRFEEVAITYEPASPCLSPYDSLSQVLGQKKGNKKDAVKNDPVITF